MSDLNMFAAGFVIAGFPLIVLAVKFFNDSAKYLDRLIRIAAEEKPTSNATVRRMARIARGEE